jgi:hypothetical protein
MKWAKKDMREDGRASRFRKDSSCLDRSSNGSTCLVPNRVVKRREQRDNPKQNRKRRVKLKLLIRNIPKEGDRAKEILKAR